MRRNIPNGKVLVEMLQDIIDALIHDLPVQAFLLNEFVLNHLLHSSMIPFERFVEF